MGWTRRKGEEEGRHALALNRMGYEVGKEDRRCLVPVCSCR